MQPFPPEFPPDRKATDVICFAFAQSGHHHHTSRGLCFALLAIIILWLGEIALDESDRACNCFFTAVYTGGPVKMPRDLDLKALNFELSVGNFPISQDSNALLFKITQLIAKRKKSIPFISQPETFIRRLPNTLGLRWGSQ